MNAEANKQRFRAKVAAAKSAFEEVAVDFDDGDGPIVVRLIQPSVDERTAIIDRATKINHETEAISVSTADMQIGAIIASAHTADANGAWEKIFTDHDREMIGKSSGAKWYDKLCTVAMGYVNGKEKVKSAKNG